MFGDWTYSYLWMRTWCNLHHNTAAAGSICIILFVHSHRCWVTATACVIYMVVRLDILGLISCKLRIWDTTLISDRQHAETWQRKRFAQIVCGYVMCCLSSGYAAYTPTRVRISKMLVFALSSFYNAMVRGWSLFCWHTVVSVLFLFI